MSLHLKLELAQVDSVEDPLGLGRLRVLYADGLVSDWLQLTSPFAGPGYGMFALPQTGAPALVAFAMDDRTCGYVIGFPCDGKAKPIVDDKQKQPQVWALQTNKKKKITLDDSDQSSIEITDEKGNLVRFDTSNNTVSIVSKGDLSIKADGKITIEGRAIDLNTQQGLSIKANGTITIEGDEIDLNAKPG